MMKDFVVAGEQKLSVFFVFEVAVIQNPNSELVTNCAELFVEEWVGADPVCI